MDPVCGTTPHCLNRKRKSHLLLLLLLLLLCFHWHRQHIPRPQHWDIRGLCNHVALYTTVLLSLVRGHKLWYESARAQDWSWSGLPCLNSPWPACSSGLLGLAVTASSLIVHMSTANIFYFVWHSPNFRWIAGSNKQLTLHWLRYLPLQHQDVVQRNTDLVQKQRSWDVRTQDGA